MVVPLDVVDVAVPRAVVLEVCTPIFFVSADSLYGQAWLATMSTR